MEYRLNVEEPPIPYVDLGMRKAEYSDKSTIGDNLKKTLFWIAVGTLIYLSMWVWHYAFTNPNVIFLIIICIISLYCWVRGVICFCKTLYVQETTIYERGFQIQKLYLMGLIKKAYEYDFEEMRGLKYLSKATYYRTKYSDLIQTGIKYWISILDSNSKEKKALKGRIWLNSIRPTFITEACDEIYDAWLDFEYEHVNQSYANEGEVRFKIKRNQITAGRKFLKVNGDTVLKITSVSSGKLILHTHNLRRNNGKIKIDYRKMHNQRSFLEILAQLHNINLPEIHHIN